MLLAACGPLGAGGTSSGVAADGRAKAKAPVTLRVHTRTGNDLDKYFLLRKPDFEAQLPHVTLEIDAIAGGPLDYVTKLLVVHSAGDLGDAAWGTSRAGYTKQLASRNVFAPLEPLAKTDKFPLTEYYPNALSEATWQGKLMSLPHITEPGRVGLMWNKSLLGSTSVKPPDLTWTFDTLRDAAVALSKGPADSREQYGLIGVYGYLDFMPILRSFGGELLSADGTRCVLDTPQGLAAIQWQHDMIRRQYAVPAPGQGPPGGFNGGNYAMQTVWPVAIKQTPKQLAGAFEVGSTLIPKGPRGERGSILNSHTMGVTSTTKKAEEAWAWVKWSCSKDFAVHRILSGNGGPVGRPDVWRNDQVLRDIPEWKDWIELMDTAKPNHIPANLRGQDVEEALNKHLTTVWRGELAPADGIKQAVIAINEILRQPA
jgi:multiple sugar transport system substrate-binding protein